MVYRDLLKDKKKAKDILNNLSIEIIQINKDFKYETNLKPNFDPDGELTESSSIYSNIYIKNGFFSRKIQIVNMVFFLSPLSGFSTININYLDAYNYLKIKEKFDEYLNRNSKFFKKIKVREIKSF